MHESEAAHDAVRRDPIDIHPYDTAWPESFEQQRLQVEPVLRPWLIGSVEHVGSTAVPGLPAKPIIDMMAMVPSYEQAQGAVAAMREIGWTQVVEAGDEELRRWSFCYPEPAWRTHHLHVVEYVSQLGRDCLAFRDHLRHHPDDARRYAEIKQSLAAVHHDDRPAYRAGKAPFIEDIMRRASVQH